MRYKTANLDDFTLYIPIRDRTCCIQRLVKYYDDLPCRKLFIDSTAAPYTSQNRIGAFEYYHVGPYQYHRKVHMILHDMIKTPLVLDICDDDVALKSAIVDSAEFLRAHPDYVLCDGEYVDLIPDFLLDPRNRSSYTAMSMAQPTSSVAAYRVLIGFRHYVARNHAVMRTDVSRLIFKTFVENDDLQPIKFVDRVFTSIAAIKGNFRVLPQLYQIKTNRGRISHRPAVRRELRFGCRIMAHLESLRPISDLLAAEQPFPAHLGDPHAYFLDVMRYALKFRGMMNRKYRRKHKPSWMDSGQDQDIRELLETVRDLG